MASRLLRLFSLCLLGAATPCLLAQAPPGYKTYENKTAPLQFFYPVAYQEVPLPPTELVLVAKFLMKDRPLELKKVSDQLYKAVEQQLEVYRFDLPAATT
ncbi:MAG: hypothetical protein KA020_12460, partial [Planctomycetes bacterium]|nr:hypothetical protein [Planctomycetota bacterium]